MNRERTTRTPDLHRMGEQFLLGLDGKVLDPRITDVLYDNPFALDEMVKGNLTIYKVIIDAKIKDYVVYNPLKARLEAQSSAPQAPRPGHQG